MKMNKILPGHKYVANFLDAPVDIGWVFRMDDKQFIPAISFKDAFPETKLKKWISSGSQGSIKFAEAKSVSFSFGGSATTAAGQSAVTIKFKRARSVAGVIDGAQVDTLRFENVKEQLKELWREKGFVKFLPEYIFVYEIVTAASGTLIYSDEKKNEVGLNHTLGAKVTKLADLGSGNFSIETNVKQTLEIIRNVAHKPLFKAFRFRKNWAPEILG
jgi:hypothetical protein